MNIVKKEEEKGLPSTCLQLEDEGRQFPSRMNGVRNGLEGMIP